MKAIGLAAAPYIRRPGVVVVGIVLGAYPGPSQIRPHARLSMWRQGAQDARPAMPAPILTATISGVLALNPDCAVPAPIHFSQESDRSAKCSNDTGSFPATLQGSPTIAPPPPPFFLIEPAANHSAESRTFWPRPFPKGFGNRLNRIRRRPMNPLKIEVCYVQRILLDELTKRRGSTTSPMSLVKEITLEHSAISAT